MLSRLRLRTKLYGLSLIHISEPTRPIEQLHRGGLTRRHVGVVDEHHLHPLQAGLLDRLEVGQETRLLVQRVGHHLPAGEFHRSAVGGVARIGNQHLVSLIEKGHADVHQPLFRTDQRIDLRLPVELHAVIALIPLGEGFAQNGFALIGHIFVHIGTLRFARQRVDHLLRRRKIGAAHGQLDDLTAGRRFRFGDLAQTTREIVFADAVQPV